MAGAPRVVRTRRARQDLIEIWKYIAADNPTAADALPDRIDESWRMLAAHPQLGPSRDDIRPSLRYFVVGDYVILHRIIDVAVEIIRVVHGRRDLFGLF